VRQVRQATLFACDGGCGKFEELEGNAEKAETMPMVVTFTNLQTGPSSQVFHFCLDCGRKVLEQLRSKAQWERVP
jgi:hypothetical protein